MKNARSIPMEALIKRSSLGSKQARLARSRVSRARAEELARAAAQRAQRRAENRRTNQG